MKKKRKDRHFIKKPTYPGGPKALKIFISTHLKYPEEAREKNIKGTVTLRYTIDQHGRVVDAKIISGLGHGCDEEAIRVVKMLRFDVPKNPLRVLFQKTIHIHFHPQRPASVTTSIRYQITPSGIPEGTPGTKDTEGENGYTYTIEW